MALATHPPLGVRVYEDKEVPHLLPRFSPCSVYPEHGLRFFASCFKGFLETKVQRKTMFIDPGSCSRVVLGLSINIHGSSLINVHFVHYTLYISIQLQLSDL
jgi:hypothetical protein